MIPSVTHVGFADESNWNVGHFGSLGLVTFPVQVLDELHRGLKRLLEGSGITEFKWQKLRQARERFAAQKMCNFAVDRATEEKLRVDVLIWDTRDSRHQVAGRDEVANLQRMYYHIFYNVLRARWPDKAVWRLHPDEHTALDWGTVRDCLEAKSTNLQLEHSIFTGGMSRMILRCKFGIEEICAVSSAEHPLLQLTDLFAGLAAFSHEKFEDYQKWVLTTSTQQMLLFDEADGSSDSSRALRERFTVLKGFDEACKRRKLGVSLKRRQGLWTPNPSNPINFWMYEPQHPEDRAPQKGKQ